MEACDDSGILRAFSFGAITCGAQTTAAPAAPAAPVPPQIAAAQKIFVSNGGNDCFDSRSSGTDQPYDQIYADLKQWARYQLVPGSQGSDLVFEVRFSCPADVVKGGEYSSEFLLTIYDPKNHVSLWTIAEPVDSAVRATTADKNLASAANAIVDDLKTLIGQSTASQAH